MSKNDDERQKEKMRIYFRKKREETKHRFDGQKRSRGKRVLDVFRKWIEKI